MCLRWLVAPTSLCEAGTMLRQLVLARLSEETFYLLWEGNGAGNEGWGSRFLQGGRGVGCLHVSKMAGWMWRASQQI